MHLGMLEAFSSAFAPSVVICASIHVHPDDCNELSYCRPSVLKPPEFINHLYWYWMWGFAFLRHSKYVHFKVPNKSYEFQKVYRLPDLLKMGFQTLALLVRALRPVLGATAVIKYLDNQQAFANKPLIWCPVLPDLIIHVANNFKFHVTVARPFLNKL